MPGLPSLTRRKMLATGGIALVAGCISSEEEEETPENDDREERDPDLRIGERFLSSAFPIELVEPDFEPRTGFADDARITYVHWHGKENSHWHQSPLSLSVGETRAGRTRFLVEGAEEISLGPEEAFSQTVVPADDPVTVAVDAGQVTFSGATPGETEVRFELRAEGELRWESPPLPVEVT
jgi:hypothetical protein